MLIAKVVGTVVATKKEASLVGKKLMLIAPLKNGGYTKECIQVAVDSVGAGMGEVVLVSQGGAARMTGTDTAKPIDLNIIGIIDNLEAGGNSLFDAESAFPSLT